MKFRELKKLLSKYGIEWDETRGKGSLGAFVGLSFATRIRRVYTLPAYQQKNVSKAYLGPLRRAFELTTEYGFADDMFQ